MSQESHGDEQVESTPDLSFEQSRDGADGGNLSGAGQGSSERDDASTSAGDEVAAEDRARAELMERISAAGVTTLGRVALVADGETSAEDHRVGGRDVYPWSDAARWSPEDGHVGMKVLDDRLDDLFAEIPDEDLGSVEDIGWYGLLRHVGQPGGFVLYQDSLGFRGAWEFSSHGALAGAWDAVQREYDAFLARSRALNREPGERDDDQEHAETPSGHHPEFWVGSTADYANGRAHGIWLDATLSPDELGEAVRFMLRNGYTPDAEAWAILGYDDFCGLDLGEHPPLETVSGVARGIANHGEAFAHWIAHVHDTSPQALAEFSNYYLGHFDTVEEYADHIRDETHATARDIRAVLHITDAADGGVHLFQRRTRPPSEAR